VAYYLNVRLSEPSDIPISSPAKTVVKWRISQVNRRGILSPHHCNTTRKIHTSLPINKYKCLCD
jgi:hypothetical protein